MDSSFNVVHEGVTFASDTQVSFSELSHVIIRPGCTVQFCHIQGTPEAPIIIERDVELVQCQIRSFPSSASFRFGSNAVQATSVSIGEGSKLHGVRIENSKIGRYVTGSRAQVSNSLIGDHCSLRCHANLVLTHAAAHSSLGSEVSKTLLLGEGFVSEHTASYLSLWAPSAFPILTADGKERLIEGLPNLTNIGAGTVFANYSGKPKPAERLEASSGSQKGTALVYGAFTAVNSIIVNRYGQPSPDEDPFSLLRRTDLTILGLASLVEHKVTGRIPAFSRATQTSAKSIAIGWVLEHQPGIVHNILKKTKKRLGPAQAGRLHDWIEGTIRLEMQLLREQLEGTSLTFFTQEQIQAGLKLYQKHLDGRWAINEEGQLQVEWSFDQCAGKWSPLL